ncbi:rubredoxin [Nevskia sp.]|uniref:rubredoxin n=1 Tax=Nevskia sp. TaxID=1929292 RepID=UPI003F6FB634
MQVSSIETSSAEVQTAWTITAATCFRCPNCAYVYNPALGCPKEGYPAGTTFENLPRSWQCPDCAVREKPDFVAISA